MATNLQSPLTCHQEVPIVCHSLTTADVSADVFMRLQQTAVPRISRMLLDDAGAHTSLSQQLLTVAPSYNALPSPSEIITRSP